MPPTNPTGFNTFSAERDKEIVRLREVPTTYQAIGDRYGLTRERIRQILKRNGKDGRVFFAPKTDFICQNCNKKWVDYSYKKSRFCSLECAHEFRKIGDGKTKSERRKWRYQNDPTYRKKRLDYLRQRWAEKKKVKKPL